MFRVKKIPIKKCAEWIFSSDKIHHISNRFFNILFVKASKDEFVMIQQEEIGLLGVLIKEINNQKYWLIQNKPEPGNMKNYHHLAPTVQATKSNFERVHGGKYTNYLEYFFDANNVECDILGSEQGDRFINKFNRNCKIILDDSLKILSDNHSWFNITKLKNELLKSYRVNTDLRSVIASGRWDLITNNIDNIFLDSELETDLKISLNLSYHTIDEIIFKKVELLTGLICEDNQIEFEILPINYIIKHTINEFGIIDDNKNRIVSFFEIKTDERETDKWQQPLLLRSKMDYCILAYYTFKGITKFYLKAYSEIGYSQHSELGATFQSGSGPFKYNISELMNILKNIDVLIDIEQSDEGGRFYQNRCKYIIGEWILSPTEIEEKNGIWLTLGDLEKLSTEKGNLSNEVRTLLSMILAYA